MNERKESNDGNFTRLFFCPYQVLTPPKMRAEQKFSLVGATLFRSNDGRG